MDIREEILRKRRAGKLPGDTTSHLKAWWQSHSKWPYPTVSITIFFIVSVFKLHSLNFVAGGRQGEIGARDGFAVEADKQLVYKPKKKELA